MVASLVADHSPSVLGVATGSSPMPAYAAMAEGRMVASSTHLCLLDEYVGLPPDHRQRYRNVIARAVAEPLGIPPSQVHAPDVDQHDLDAAAADYERELDQLGGVDVQLLGIGRNGHIGFNEPGTPFDSLTHLTPLDTSTRDDNARFFAQPGEVPLAAITQGLATIRRSRSIVLIATGPAKRPVMGHLLSGRVSLDLPASCLHQHPDVTIVGDRDALGDLDLNHSAEVPA